MKKLSKIKLNNFHEMNAMEMQKIVGGGYSIIGLRYDGSQCYCDFLYTDASGVEIEVCNQPCEMIWCEEAGFNTGIGYL